MRARFYNPADGRFQSRDTWGGDANRPMSMNRWMYTSGNPTNLTDPSGRDPWWCEERSNAAECINVWIDANKIHTLTASHAPIPTSTPQLTTATNNPYDANAAVARALHGDEKGEKNWADDMTPDSDAGCTVFLSAVLRAGGIDFDDIRTQSLKEFLNDRYNFIQFTSPNDRGVRLRETSDWQEFISKNAGRIHPGDIVFFNASVHNIVQKVPDHVAIIVNVGLPETTMYTSTTTGNSMPGIVEQDGRLNEACLSYEAHSNVPCGSTSEAGRSIDDSPSMIDIVQIFLMAEPK